MTTDLVKRLRKDALSQEQLWTLRDAAADRIEQLEAALRRIAFRTLKRKMLKDPPPAFEYWTDLFCSPKEWAVWVEDLGEIAKAALEEGGKTDAKPD